MISLVWVNGARARTNNAREHEPCQSRYERHPSKHRSLRIAQTKQAKSTNTDLSGEMYETVLPMSMGATWKPTKPMSWNEGSQLETHDQSMNTRASEMRFGYFC